jgi:hypothetical protein
MKLFSIIYGKWADKHAVVRANNAALALLVLENSAPFQLQANEFDRDIGYAMVEEIIFENDKDYLIIHDADI